MRIISTVFKKEILDMYRDKKTLITSILIPLILFPIMFGFMGKGIGGDREAVEKSTKIAIVNKDNSKIKNFLESKDNIKVVDVDDIEKAVDKGKILVAVTIPEGFDKAIENEENINLEIFYDSSSTKSSMALGIISSYIEEYSKTIVAERLSARDIDASILSPISISRKAAVKEEEGIGKMMLAMMLPMMIMIYCATGPLPAATDLGAGEKERGTLEPLLTTQAGRMSLLWGKFFAITVMGMITALASLAGIYIAMLRNPEMFGAVNGEISIAMGLNQFIIIAVFAILATMIFGALELAISIYARSFKEAQTYLTPITLIGMFAAFSSYMIDVKTAGIHWFILPVVNATATLKEVTMGIINYTHIGLAAGSSLIYVIIAVAIARYMFSREDVIFRT